jgi:hypothetical protein
VRVGVLVLHLRRWSKMPKTTKSGKAIEDELPSTLQRSDAKAKQTFAETYDSAIEQYDGDEQRAHQVAFSS